MEEITIEIEEIDPIEFFGANNAKLELIKKAFPDIKINARGTQIRATGKEADLKELQSRITFIIDFIKKHGKINPPDIEGILDHAEGFKNGVPEVNEDVILHGPNSQVIRAKTPNQRELVKHAADNDILFAIGPAGTGKTYTAVALAVKALKEKQVKKIILTRPAVEAGENLGFLPGDLKEKVDPYLRPLYDALDDMLPSEKLNMYIETRVIEIAPIAFMRGRTLNNAFIILDEAQNATDAQLKMFLTRIGPVAKCIVTGDLTQIDLPRKEQSGLSRAIKILDSVPGIAIIYLDEKDVIRHKLVKDIIKAYQQLEDKNDR